MATRITRVDLLRIRDLLTAVVGEDCQAGDRVERFLTIDNWSITVGGWSHGLPRGWTRGFMIGDHTGCRRGYVGPKPDNDRYEGRGWHARIAADILDELSKLRLANPTD